MKDELLLAALKEYGNHKEDCNKYMAWGPGPNPCDCGLSDFIGDDSLEENLTIDDGFGNIYVKCTPDCSLEIVRPGKTQCNQDSEHCYEEND